MDPYTRLADLAIADEDLLEAARLLHTLRERSPGSATVLRLGAARETARQPEAPQRAKERAAALFPAIDRCGRPHLDWRLCKLNRPPPGDPEGDVLRLMLPGEP